MPISPSGEYYPPRVEWPKEEWPKDLAESIDAKNVNAEVNPVYYKDLDPEPIEVIEKWGLGYHLGQVVKYVARAGKKVVDGDARQSRLLDLRKARWYLDREIGRLGG